MSDKDQPNLSDVDRRMKPRDDGGPAFPAIVETRHADPRVVDAKLAGMSLRDYFAAHNGPSIQVHLFTGADGKLEVLHFEFPPDAEQQIAEWKARMAFRIADAMIAERKK